jgi:hypothetical protein
MPLKLSPTNSDTFFIIGKDDSGNPGVALLPGQSVSVTSADPSTVVITMDSPAKPTLGAAGVPDGTLTLASGTVKAASPVAQMNVAINVTAHIANADGNPVLDDSGVAIPDQVDTVTIQANLLKSIGELFGTATA